MTAACADYARAERPDGGVIRHVIGIHGDAVIAVDRAAINEQVSASVGPDMAESYRLERFPFLAGH
jgi:hypothetical protein